MTMSSNLDFSGLDNFSELLKNPQAHQAGAPLQIAVDAIEPDPDQPRKTIDEEKIAELAQSIRAQGLLQPIIVRPKPDVPGRYFVSYGERRWRAHKRLELETIEAYVKEDAGEGRTLRLGQIVENVQRENLSVSEIVDAIARLLADGMKQTEIATQLGKGKAWVSKHAALLKLPDPLAELLKSGQARDASTLYEALQCWKADEATVRGFLDELGEGQLVQADVERWRAAIAREKSAPAPDTGAGRDDTADATSPDNGSDPVETGSADGDKAPSPAADGDSTATAMGTAGSTPEALPEAQGVSGDDADDDADNERQQSVQPAKRATDPDKFRKPLLQVRVGRREAILIPTRRAEYGLAWVQYEDGTEEAVDALKIKLVAITEGNKAAQ